ncbi:MFS general substrate transporter [Pseudovirgaria hyperparasitica]|uniref:MFS general substrate transporter n=1 Tax=Pseudovirgaria hyperparasitica TaxID=470096 RepID=A0A6A6WFI6_9PEZI|nr:MFS general substrate transporter [Pseudovirgaria hyperparasitica]KAF2759881.1 MFS general substrate transporter [Pseudovirgaria hyperparasitica]
MAETETPTVDQTHTEKSDLAKDLTEPTDERKIRGFKWVLIAVLILSNLLFYAVDNTIVAVIQPAIIKAFSNVQDLPWVSVGFTLPGSACALILGKLYGVFDAKLLYIEFSLLFLIGSAICGAAPSMTAMIFGRVIAGLGGTGMYLGALTLISVLTTKKETPTYMGFLSLVWGFGTIIGPLIGGAFTDSSATWRWGFYINVVAVGVSIPVYITILPGYTPAPSSDFGSRIRSVDWLGAILSAGAFTAGIMATSFGGTLYEWSSGQIISLFTVSGLLFVAFFVQQHFAFLTSSTLRLSPFHLLRIKDVFICFVCQTSVALIVPVPLYYIPLFLQLTRGASAIEAGVKLLPLICTWVFAGICQGKLMGKLGWYQPWFLLGSGMNLISGVFMSRIDTDTDLATIYGLQAVLGLGLGCYGQAGYAVVQQFVKQTEMHAGISLMLVAQLTGTVLGLAIGGAIFQNVSIGALHRLLPTLSEREISGVISGVGIDQLNVVTAEVQSEVRVVLTNACIETFTVIYAFAALAFLAACFFTPKKIF